MSCFGSVAKASSTTHSLQTGSERFKGNLTQSNGIMWNLKRIPLIYVSSRCLRATRLNTSTLWWRGPDFLSKHESEWPKVKIAKGLEVKTESKTKFISAPSVNFVVRTGSEDCKWILHPSNWSSWLKLTRVVAWVQSKARCQLQISSSRTPERISFSRGAAKC